MGITVANALSEWLTAETSDGETSSLQRFERGVPVGEMVQSSAAWHGLRVRFKPDPTIFELPCFLQKDIVSRVVELTALNPDIKVEVSDERTSESGVIAFPDGAAGLVRLMNRGLTPAYDDILAVSHRSDSFRLDVALQHVEEPGLRARPYVNAIHTIEGGTLGRDSKRA